MSGVKGGGITQQGDGRWSSIIVLSHRVNTQFGLGFEPGGLTQVERGRG